MIYPSLATAIQSAKHLLVNQGEYTPSQSWQGRERTDPMWELNEFTFRAPINVNREDAKVMIKPNYEWAEAQFLERVGGKPLNPGESYKIWPFYKNNKSNDTFRIQEKFDHTYMERFWPKHAGDAILIGNNQGIRFNYGDYQDVVNLLKRNPSTRQAFLPIWFPEDTGNNFNGRVPCTLGYLFYIRNGALNITYYIRSCDFLRHFRDDVYLAYLLAVHTRDLVNSDKNLSLGFLTMHIASLHIFYKELKLVRDELN